jgi:hypothetical protein
MNDEKVNEICDNLELIVSTLSDIGVELEIHSAPEVLLTRRDKFAMAAMQAIIPGSPCSPGAICIEAYMYADQMIEISERENT